jgi:hypothetical protein
MVCNFPAFVAASVILRTNLVSFSCICCRFRFFTNKWCLVFLHLLPLPSFYEQMVCHFPAFCCVFLPLAFFDMHASLFPGLQANNLAIAHKYHYMAVAYFPDRHLWAL